jgi:hypothetical protein
MLHLPPPDNVFKSGVVEFQLPPEQKVRGDTKWPCCGSQFLQGFQTYPCMPRDSRRSQWGQRPELEEDRSAEGGLLCSVTRRDSASHLIRERIWTVSSVRGAEAAPVSWSLSWLRTLFLFSASLQSGEKDAWPNSPLAFSCTRVDVENWILFYRILYALSLLHIHGSFTGSKHQSQNWVRERIIGKAPVFPVCTRAMYKNKVLNLRL